MTATVTNILKKQLAQELFDDIQDSSSSIYYIGIGRSEDWPNDSDVAVTPINTEREVRNALLSLQSVKRVTDYTFTIPRYNWSSGSIYSSYDDNAVGQPLNSYYVLTDENQVYICLQTPKNANGNVLTSTVKPTGTLTTAFDTADGYTWKYMYSIGALDASKFLAANFIPVKYIDSTDIDSASSPTDILMENVHANAIGGEVLNIVMTNVGTGYTSDPTIQIIGDGDSATAVVNARSGNQINSISVTNSGSGYTKAYVKITGGNGTGAKARAVISPKNGIGFDPRDDLRSTGIMFNTKPDGTESGKFIVDNDFRQVLLLKNVLIADSDALFTGSSGLALRKMIVSGGTGFQEDRIMIGGTSGARGIIDYVDSSNIYYHAAESDGFFLSFQIAEALTTTPAGGTGTVLTDSSQDIEPLSGDVLYIDNRAAITRSVDQIEDLKIVIQL